MKKINISLISYLNTLPFVYGIKNSSYIKNHSNLFYDYPSECAEKLLAKEVDIGIVPIAFLPKLKNYHIISDYCIGSKNKVATVSLFSDVPLLEIKSIYLDYQSVSSVNLVKVLAKHFWNINPSWITAQRDFEKNINGNVAGVVIGDRTFELNKKFKYIYDLSDEWYKFTGLPFVFACWVSTKKVEDEFISELNGAFKNGTSNISKVIDSQKETNILSNDELRYYFTNNIIYNFNDEMKQGMNTFLNFLK